MAGDKVNFDAAIKKGDSLAWLGKWEEAAAEFARAVKDSPDSALGRESLAMALAHIRRYNDALAEYEVALSRLPDNMILRGKVADLHGKLGDVEKFAAGNMALAEEFIKVRNYGRAVAAWRNVLTLAPRNLEARTRLAETLDRGGDTEEAALEYKELARYVRDSGDAEQAEVWAKRAWETDPDSPEIEAFYRSFHAVEEVMAKPKEASSSAGLVEILSSSKLQPAFVGDRDKTTSGENGNGNRTEPRDRESVLAAAVQTAESHRQNRLFIAAIDECLSAIELDSSYLPAQVVLAEVYGDIGRLEDAVNKYDTLAAVFLVRGEPDNAIDMYRRLLSFMPRNTEVRRRLTQLLMDLDRGPEAMFENGKLVSILIQNGDIGLAQEELQAVLPIATDLLGEQNGSPLAAILADIGDVARKQGAVDLAVECLEKAVNAGAGQDPAVLLSLGEAYSLKRQWEKAFQAFHSVKSLAPSDERPYVKCAEVLFRAGKLEAAIKEFDGLAQKQLKSGDSARALATAQVMRQLAPQSAIPRVRLSQIYMVRGLKTEAVGELQTLAEMRMKEDKLNEAEAVYRRILEVDSTRGTAYLALGEVLAAGGKLIEAKQVYERLLELEPANTVACERLVAIQGAMAD